MKKIMIIAVAVLMLSGSAYAANSLNAGSKALSIGFGDSVLNHVASPTDEFPNSPIVDIGGKIFLSSDGG